MEAIANAAALPGTATERLRHAMIDFTKVVVQRQANIAIYFREEKSLAPDALAEIDALRKRFDRLLSQLLSDGVASGEFHIRDVKLAALALGGMISWAYTWHRPDGRLTVDEMCETMADLALQLAGVHLVSRAPRGAKVTA